MKIAFYEVNLSDQKFFKEKVPEGIEQVFHTGAFSDQPEWDADIISIRSKSKLSKEDLDKFTQLKLISTRTTGLDHIDTEYCKSCGIEVKNVPGYGETTVAEHAISLILAISRNLFMSRITSDEGFHDIDSVCGSDLYGKTLAVLGTGSIGRRVASVALGLDMRVVAYDIFENQQLLDRGVEYLTLDDALRQADVISVHLPLLDSTRHILDESKFALMKNGIIFVNTSRGEVVDNSALAAALENGIIKGAGLDVVEHEEQLITGQVTDQTLRKLLANPKVIFTPHNACNSVEARIRVNQASADDIFSAVGG